MRIDPGQSQSYPQQQYPYASASQPYNPPILDDEANSDDECRQGTGTDMAARAAAEHHFVQRLAQRGLELKRMVPDGNCLFRSVADRVYGDAEMHDVARRLCLDHIEKERDHFSQYVTQDFDTYVARKRRDRVYGNHLEIQAISEIYNRPVHVFDAHGDPDTPMNIFTAATDGEPGLPLRLSYHGRSHYNVLIDPTQADVGEGLGLPGHQPGMADRMQLEQAAKESETSALEAQLLMEAQRSSEVEIERDQDALLQAALHASLAEVHSQMTGCSSNSASAGPASSGNAYVIKQDLRAAAVEQQQLMHAFSGGSSGPQAASSAAGALSSGGGGGGSGGDGSGGPAQHASSGGLPNDGAVVNESVQMLLAMGFSLPRAVAAHEQFGDDLDSMLEYLTCDP